MGSFVTPTCELAGELLRQEQDAGSQAEWKNIPSQRWRQFRAETLPVEQMPLKRVKEIRSGSQPDLRQGSSGGRLTARETLS
jgi:hypothetical protein